MYFTKKNYERSSFKFFSDRIEFLEGFLIKQRKIVYFDQISEVSLTEGFVQRSFGLGTIVLSTRATSGGTNDTGQSGVLIMNIENPELTFNKVKEIVKKK